MNSGQQPNNFTLDRIFDINTNQEQIYNEVARPVTEDILKGFNGTVFTYGQSGSGKTFTMYGADLYDPNLKGIIPRTIDHIFDTIDDPKNKDIKFELKFSMLEIYKESLYDLLNPETKTSDLKIKENPKKGIYVTNLSEEYISNQDEILELIETAEDYRVVSATKLNKQSSRSHLLFQMEITQKMPDGVEKKGILNLIDLAGSEKVSKTGAQGDTLEEAKKINLSLSTLGNVISALSSGTNDFVPYRDSKLTRILQDSLGGNSKTTLIVTCSPHMYNCEETIGTLKFASRAKKIKNKVKCNIKRSVEQLEEMIEVLTRQLVQANSEILRLNGTPIQIKYLDNSRNNDNCQLLEQNSNKSTTQLDLIIDSEAFKAKDEEIDNLKNEMENLKKENFRIEQELKTIERHNNYDKVLFQLDIMMKSNVKDMKDIPVEMEKLIIESLRRENQRLRERCKKIERNYQKALKELSSFFKPEKKDEVTKYTENLDTNCVEKLHSIKLTFKEFFNYLDHHLSCNDKINCQEQSICRSYRNIFLEAKIYSHEILNEFIKKHDIFENRLHTTPYKLPKDYYFTQRSSLTQHMSHRSLHTINLNQYNKQTQNTQPNFNFSNQPQTDFDNDYISKEEYMKLKNSYMKLSLLTVYHEKLIFDLMNRVVLDLEKFELESKIKINLEDKCQNMNKIMYKYMEVLEEMKQMRRREMEDPTKPKMDDGYYSAFAKTPDLKSPGDIKSPDSNTPSRKEAKFCINPKIIELAKCKRDSMEENSESKGYTIKSLAFRDEENKPEENINTGYFRQLGIKEDDERERHSSRRKSVLSVDKKLSENTPVILINPSYGMRRGTSKNLVKPMMRGGGMSNNLLGMMNRINSVNINPIVKEESESGTERTLLSESPKSESNFEKTERTKKEQKTDRSKTKIIDNVDLSQLVNKLNGGRTFNIRNENNYANFNMNENGLGLNSKRDMFRRGTPGLKMSLKRASAAFSSIRDSMASAYIDLNTNRELEIVTNELKNLRKEYEFVKNILDSIANEDLSLKNIKAEFLKLINVFQENQRELFKIEVDNFKRILDIYKKFIEDEFPDKKIDDILEGKRLKIRPINKSCILLVSAGDNGDVLVDDV